MSTPSINIVYRPRSSLLDIIDVADANGWTEAQRFKRGERQLEELIYELPDGETVVRGIDDHFVMVVFASVTGPKAADAEKLLRQSGDALEESTLWEWVSSKSSQERSHALRAFAATSEKEADPRIVEAYTNATKDGDPIVRQALIESVGRAAWPELWPIVEELAKSGDADSRVLRESYERHLPRSK